MKRSDIRGFTINLFGYYLEIVTVYHIPCEISLSRGIKIIFRLEVK